MQIQPVEKMMRLERTRDMEVVATILSHPDLFPHLHDDSVTECAPVDHEGLNWMLVDDGEPAGVFLVHALNSTCYQMHTALLPRTWGGQAAAAAQMLLRWAFTETACRKMTTLVPAYNRAALRFAKAGGMTVEGVNRASFLRNGAMIDQIMLGITQQEWLCQH